MMFYPKYPTALRQRPVTHQLSFINDYNLRYPFLPRSPPVKQKLATKVATAALDSSIASVAVWNSISRNLHDLSNSKYLLITCPFSLPFSFY